MWKKLLMTGFCLSALYGTHGSDYHTPYKPPVGLNPDHLWARPCPVEEPKLFYIQTP